MTDANSLSYVVEYLFALMWRKGQPDPYGAKELGDVVQEILWVRSYVGAFLRQHPYLFKTGCNSNPSSQQDVCDSNPNKVVRDFLDSPMKFFMKTEGPDRDPTWQQALTTDALRLAMKHFLDLNQGYYRAEIKGALSQPQSDRFNLEKFRRGTRVVGLPLPVGLSQFWRWRRRPSHQRALLFQRRLYLCQLLEEADVD